MSGPKEITHTQLFDAYDNAQAFFGESRNDLAGNFIVEKLYELQGELKSITGFHGCFGVGYPFYATTSQGEVLPVPSIRNFLDDTKADIRISQLNAGENWPCPGCQEENNFEDLGANCKPCNRVSFKPRDFFRGMPDLDVIAVFDSPTIDTENQVENAIKNTGLNPFSQNIRKAFTDSMLVLKGAEAGKLPLDFHMVSLDDFIACCDLIKAGKLDEQIGIATRSLRANWKSLPIDFSYSFAFSMAEVGRPLEPLPTVIAETRKMMIQNLGVSGILGMVEKSRRCGAVIADLALRELLIERVSGW